MAGSFRAPVAEQSHPYGAVHGAAPFAWGST